MRKLFIFPLLAGAFALSACGMFEISTDDVTNILDTSASLADKNGYFIGGNNLTSKTSLSTIKYDLDSVIVEKKEVVTTEYFDISNKYYHSTVVDSELFIDSTRTSTTKLVEYDTYSYVRNNIVVNAVITKVNNQKVHTVISKVAANDLELQRFNASLKASYRTFRTIFEEAVTDCRSLILEKDNTYQNVDASFNSYGADGFELEAVSFYENTNLYIKFRYGQLAEFDLVNWSTGTSAYSTFSYGQVSLDYIDD